MTRVTLTAEQEAELRAYADGEPRKGPRRPNTNLIRRNLVTLAPTHGQGYYRITEVGRAALAERAHEEAIREWIARKIRGRGHTDVTRDHVGDVRYAVDYGYGSDVTPAEDPEASLTCTLKRPGRAPHEHAESLEGIRPAALVEECLAIMAEIA